MCTVSFYTVHAINLYNKQVNLDRYIPSVNTQRDNIVNQVYVVHCIITVVHTALKVLIECLILST